MKHRILAEVDNQSARLHSVNLAKKGQKGSTHPDHKRPIRPLLVRASTPSRYLKRRGLMPSPNAFGIAVGRAGIVALSSSSSTSSSSSSTSIPSRVNSRSSNSQKKPPCLPSLTGDNLARLMLQLEGSSNSSAQRYNFHSHSKPTSNPLGISYFSSESSACSDSDDSEF